MQSTNLQLARTAMYKRFSKQLQWRQQHGILMKNGMEDKASFWSITECIS